MSLSRRLVPAALAGLVAAAGLGLGSSALAGTRTVSVLYAGSLQYQNDQVLGPAFASRYGVRYQGHGGSTLAVAQEIVSGELSGSAFEAIGTKGLAAVGSKIMPWAIAVAAQPLVVAYNPKSRFAPQFKAIATGRKPLKDLFTLLETPGLRLGRTDPATDPQGQAFVLMVELATRLYHLPADTPAKILGNLETSNQIFEEAALPAQIQADALDAESAFLPEAVQFKMPYITLPPALDFADPADNATYAKASFTLPGKPKVTGKALAIYAGPLFLTGAQTGLGVDWVRFLLSPKGQALWHKYAYSATAPAIYGKARLVPPTILKEVRALSRTAS